MDPSDDLIQGALRANGGEAAIVKAWRTAQDGTSTVVEMGMGWSRKPVFSLPDRETTPRTVVQHNLLWSKRLR